jgi:hypothetical protein
LIVSKYGTGDEWRSVGPTDSKFISRRKAISYIQLKEGRVTGSVTSGVGTAS